MLVQVAWLESAAGPSSQPLEPIIFGGVVDRVHFTSKSTFLRQAGTLSLFLPLSLSTFT